MKRVLTTLLKSVCIIALVLCGMDAQAQGNLVTGAVRDAKGEPVIGATVIVKGTATGATIPGPTAAIRSRRAPMRRSNSAS